MGEESLILAYQEKRQPVFLRGGGGDGGSYVTDKLQMLQVTQQIFVCPCLKDLSPYSGATDTPCVGGLLVMSPLNFKARLD